MASDGAGGGLVAWEDFRSGTKDIYARRVNAAGAPQWAEDGVALCTATNDQNFPMAVSVGGTVIATTEDYRGGTASDIPARVALPANTTVGGGGAADLEPLLSEASPNPARAGTEVRLRLSQAAEVRMEVFDTGGRRVRCIPVGARSAGEHALRWDGRDETGQPVATGLYFLRLGVARGELTRRLVVAR